MCEVKWQWTATINYHLSLLWNAIFNLKHWRYVSSPANPVKGVGVSVVPTLELDVDVDAVPNISNQTFTFLAGDHHQHILHMKLNTNQYFDKHNTCPTIFTFHSSLEWKLGQWHHSKVWRQRLFADQPESESEERVSESDASESGNYANESESDSYASESQWKWGQWHLSKVWRQLQFADQPEAPAMRSQNANDILQMEIWGNLQILVFVNS